VDGVICGHIHTPTIREIDGVAYFNCGDWVESTSALLEDFSGKIELLTHFQRTFETAAPLPIVEADDIHPVVGTMEAVTKKLKPAPTEAEAGLFPPTWLAASRDGVFSLGSVVCSRQIPRAIENAAIVAPSSRRLNSQIVTFL
jgi:hypothetical protein